MCGIYGLIVNEQSRLPTAALEPAVRTLVRLSERRGREAAGLAVSSSSAIGVYKQATKPSVMLRSRAFADFLRRRIALLPSSNGTPSYVQPFAVIGHTRLVTNGSQAIQENNQPIYNEGIVGIHNGIVTNDRLLLDRYPELRRGSTLSRSDSEVLFDLLHKYYRELGEIAPALAATFDEIRGSASVAFYANDRRAVTLATNTGSLYYAAAPERGFFTFASERPIVQRFLHKMRHQFAAMPAVHQVAPRTAAMVEFHDLIATQISIDPRQPHSGGEEGVRWSRSPVETGAPSADDKCAEGASELAPAPPIKGARAPVVDSRTCGGEEYGRARGSGQQGLALPG
ncbi:MAG: hypothetical protein HY543_02225, partial [Deltaproteobacteria bacterium]|nr:hypothetical protein [Deltaproteobacteria bacterium]